MKLPNAKPKVLALSPVIGGSSEVWMYRQFSKMERIDLTAICHTHTNEPSFPADNFDVITTPAKFLKNTSRKKVGTFFKQIKRRLFPSDGMSNIGREEKAWLENELETLQPEIAICHYGTTAMRYSDLLNEKKIPFLIHFNGYDLSRLVKKKHNAIHMASIAKQAAGNVVVAEYMRQWLLDHGVADERIHKIPYGVPLADYKRSEPLEASKVVRFLVVGRLTSKKSPLLTIKAFERCYLRNPDVELDIIGDGDLWSACRELVERLNIQSVVNFHGRQPPEVVRKAMHNASVFVQHSVTADSGDKEGWPVAIAEAAASGLPIISTRHASIPEQVLEGQSGFLVAEGDWESMSDAMLKLSLDSELRKQFSSKAIDHISQWDAVNQVRLLEETIFNCL